MLKDHVRVWWWQGGKSEATTEQQVKVLVDMSHDRSESFME